MAATYDGDGFSRTDVVFAIAGAVIGGALGFALMGSASAVASGALGGLVGIMLVGVTW
jgi:hypothetical protein